MTSTVSVTPAAYRKSIFQVEDRLFPVCAASGRSCTEADGFVARIEVHVKETNQGMYIVIPVSQQQQHYCQCTSQGSL